MMVPGSVLALDVLAGITVENEHPQGYIRDVFAYPFDADGDGCNTRAEVLIRDSLTPAQIDPFGCSIVAGDWYSPYDDRTWSDPGELEVDHVVALKEAWDSGAWAWDAERRHEFGNDLADARTLRAVTGSVNTEKGDKDPSNWLPPNDAFVCTFLGDWVAIKARWALSMDPSEWGRIRNVLTDECPYLAIAPWPLTPPPPPPTTTTATTTTEAPTTTATPADTLDPRFPSCKAAKAAGYGPYIEGVDPEYNWYRDGDGDGIVCE